MYIYSIYKVLQESERETESMTVRYMRVTV